MVERIDLNALVPQRILVRVGVNALHHFFISAGPAVPPYPQKAGHEARLKK